MDPSSSPSAIEVYQLTESLRIQREASISALIQAPILDCQSPHWMFSAHSDGMANLSADIGEISWQDARPAGALGSLVLVIDALQRARTSPVSRARLENHLSVAELLHRLCPGRGPRC